jgi:hypothetical protein
LVPPNSITAPALLAISAAPQAPQRLIIPGIAGPEVVVERHAKAGRRFEQLVMFEMEAGEFS